MDRQKYFTTARVTFDQCMIFLPAHPNSSAAPMSVFLFLIMKNKILHVVIVSEILINS